ncbi:MAG: 30S ribosomal protein S20 [Patescibacteria group bacterium]
MPNTEGAKKALRVSKKKAVFNLRRKMAMKKAVKQFREMIRDGKTDEAEKEIPTVYKAIDKAQKRGVIKKNTADRKKSRLLSFLNKEKVK